MKKEITKNANNLMWVEYWIMKAHPSYEENEIYASKYDESRWICEIKLPLINETVKSISNTEANAMLNASNKAAKLIDEYMKNHSELIIQNTFKRKQWIIKSDENGNYISTEMSEKWRNREGDKYMKKDKTCIELMKKTVAKISKIKNDCGDVIIQVLPQSLFPDDMTIRDTLEEVATRIEKEYHLIDYDIEFDDDGSHIIVIGHINQVLDNHNQC